HLQHRDANQSLRCWTIQDCWIIKTVFRKPRAVHAMLSILTQDMWTAGNRLSQALQLETYFRQLSKDHEGQEVLARWEEARKLVDEAAADYVTATERLLEAARHTRRPGGRTRPTIESLL